MIYIYIIYTSKRPWNTGLISMVSVCWLQIQLALAQSLTRNIKFVHSTVNISLSKMAPLCLAWSAIASYCSWSVVEPAYNR